MTTTTQVLTRPTGTTRGAERQPVWRHGVAAAAVATVATTVLAAVTSAAGVSFADGTGTSIPLAGFAQLTLVFSLLGVGIAAVMARKARRPRSTFVRTTLALTALSFVPDLTFGFDAGSAVTLIALHTVAATIVVPSLARRLPNRENLR
jgi:amino acid transporter